MPLRVVLDTDPGIDDSLTMLLALVSPEVELAAVGVTGGNCSLDDGVRNALSVLALGGRPDVPVCPGVALPLIRPPFTAPETHGDRGLGYARLPDSPASPSNDHAVDRIIREIMAAPGEVTLIAIAPLTNVALAIRREPRIVQAVRQVIIMGGALRTDGNTTSLSEFNFFVDPHAAHIVLHSGMPITLLPWDITKDILLMQEHVDRLTAIDSPVSSFIAEATRFYMEFHLACFGYAGCSICDPGALALAFMPDLARTEPMYVSIELASELTIGKTVIGYVGNTLAAPDVHDMLSFDDSDWPPHWKRMTRRTPNVQAVVEFDSPRFITIFVERMEQLARARQTLPQRG
jgi:purine nucleosidase